MILPTGSLEAQAPRLGRGRRWFKSNPVDILIVWIEKDEIIHNRKS
jgi:hypothetical protein